MPKVILQVYPTLVPPDDMEARRPIGRDNDAYQAMLESLVELAVAAADHARAARRGPAVAPPHPPRGGDPPYGSVAQSKPGSAVELGDREVEVLGEVDEDLAARARAARLEEAEVLRGQARVQCQPHLHEPPAGCARCG